MTYRVHTSLSKSVHISALKKKRIMLVKINGVFFRIRVYVPASPIID